MPKKQKKKVLTLAEMKSLLLLQFGAEQRKQDKLYVRLQQELGNEVQEEKPEAIAIKNRVQDWVCDILARRLKRNQQTTPLLSSKDFAPLVHAVVNEVEDDKLGTGDREMLKKFMKTRFENVFEVVDIMVSSQKNPYEEYWRWITTVLGLADEQGIQPIELLKLENQTDEIKRRMFTKKQFLDLSNRTVKKFTDADVLKKILVQPMLDIMLISVELNADDRREIEQEMEKEVMPHLCEIIEKFKVVTRVWIDEEIGRIYAKA